MYQLLIGCFNSRSFLSTPLVPLVPLDPVSSVSIFLFSDRRRSRMGIGLVSSIPCHPRDPSTSSIVPAGKMPLITMPHTTAAPGTMLIRPSLRGIYLDARWQGRCKRRVGQNVNLPHLMQVIDATIPVCVSLFSSLQPASVSGNLSFIAGKVNSFSASSRGIALLHSFEFNEVRREQFLNLRLTIF